MDTDTTSTMVIRQAVVGTLSVYHVEIGDIAVMRAVDHIVQFIEDTITNVKQLQRESDDAYWKRAVTASEFIESPGETLLDKVTRLVGYYRDDPNETKPDDGQTWARQNGVTPRA